MVKYLEEFHPPERLLMGAGPSNVNPRVLRAMIEPLLGHLDPDFVGVMDDVKAMLGLVFQTQNTITVPISGTGSAGMEASLVNTLEPGDTIVVAINGYFGARLADIAERCNAQVIRVMFEWGSPIDPNVLETELKTLGRVKAVAFVHAETSTGVVNPAQDIAAIANNNGALVIMDAVTSLGGIEVPIDKWGIDVCYSGSQKCLGCPPGLSPITMSPRAEEILMSRKTPVQSWYLDLSLLRSYWGNNRVYHHTAPISMIYALREGLRVVLEEGLEERFQRHQRSAQVLHAGLTALGLDLFAHEDHRLPCLTSVNIPIGIEDSIVRRTLLTEHNIEIGGGLGPVAGKVWRIGLMGENAYIPKVLTLLSALEHALQQQGYEVAVGQSLAAAQEVLAS